LPNEKGNVVHALRTVITEATREIEPKGVDRFTADNRINILAATNFPNALKIVQSDRRWVVVMGTTDMRFCDDEGLPTPETVEYYRRLFVSIGIGTPRPGDDTNESRRILSWLKKRDISSFNGQSAAPQTEAKAYVAEVTQGNWASFLNGAKVDKAEPFTKELFTAQEALDVLAKHFPSAQHSDVRTPALNAALIECTCRKLAKQVWLSNGKRVRLCPCAGL
jgi:hypothetical protein